MTRILEALQDQLELEGHTPGTPKYERELRRLKVEQCREMQGVGSCSDCARCEFCELRVAHIFDNKYGNDNAS